ncbi:hypothetical protein Ndes2437B_g03933 [Nannochloris sp. 'desiccata']
MHELLNNGNRAVFVGSDAGTRICIEARRPEQRCGGNGLRRFACGFKHKSSSLAWELRLACKVVEKHVKRVTDRYHYQKM